MTSPLGLESHERSEKFYLRKRTGRCYVYLRRQKFTSPGRDALTNAAAARKFVAKHGEGVYQFLSDRDGRIVTVNVEPWDVDTFRAPELEAKASRLEHSLERLAADKDAEVATLNAEKNALEAKLEAVTDASAVAAMMAQMGVDELVKGDAHGGTLLRDAMGRLNALKSVRPMENIAAQFRHLALVDYLAVILDKLQDHGERGGPEIRTVNFTREQGEAYDMILQVAVKFPEIIEAWTRRAGPASDQPRPLPAPPTD